MGDENTSSAKLQCGIHAVVNKIAGGFCHQFLDGDHITQIVAMHNVDGDPDFKRGTQGICAYQVAAMDNGFRTGSMGCSNGSGKRFGAVMTIGDDADFQFFFAVI
jgi:hypothetical protein